MTVVTVARLLLAGVFAVAGAAKLGDLRGSQAALRAFGAPAGVALPLGVLLPLGELAIAGALVPASTAPYALAGALALLLTFSVGVATALARGRRPDCHCFGQLHSAPAGWTTLVRNAALAGVAALLLSQPFTSPSLVEVTALSLIALIAGQTVLCWKLIRRYGRALERIAELNGQGSEPTTLPVGAPAPRFALPAVGGGEVSLEDLLAPSRPVALVFADPGCRPCHALLPEIARWQGEYREHLAVAVVISGNERENAGVADAHGLVTVLVQEGREVAELYGVHATPSAVLIGRDGRVAQALAIGAEAIEALVRSATPDIEPAQERVGNGAPKAVAAAALAGGFVAAAAVAEAAPRAESQQPSDPELQAILAVLTAAGPRMLKASERSRTAVRAQATLRQGAAQRKKRAVAVQALAAERREALAVRAEIAKLGPVGVVAHNARLLWLDGLSLFAQSLQKRQSALVAKPKAATRLLADGERLFFRALASLNIAAKVLAGG